MVLTRANPQRREGTGESRKRDSSDLRRKRKILNKEYRKEYVGWLGTNVVSPQIVLTTNLSNHTNQIHANNVATQRETVFTLPPGGSGTSAASDRGGGVTESAERTARKEDEGGSEFVSGLWSIVEPHSTNHSPQTRAYGTGPTCSVAECYSYASGELALAGYIKDQIAKDRVPLNFQTGR